MDEFSIWYILTHFVKHTPNYLKRQICTINLWCRYWTSDSFLRSCSFHYFHSDLIQVPLMEYSLRSSQHPSSRLPAYFDELNALGWLKRIHSQFLRKLESFLSISTNSGCKYLLTVISFFDWRIPNAKFFQTSLDFERLEDLASLFSHSN